MRRPRPALPDGVFEQVGGYVLGVAGRTRDSLNSPPDASDVVCMDASTASWVLEFRPASRGDLDASIMALPPGGKVRKPSRLSMDSERSVPSSGLVSASA